MQANIDHTVDAEEFRFLLTGGIGAGEVPPNPLPWLGDKLWAEMNRLSGLLGFVGFAEELQKDPVRPCRLQRATLCLSRLTDAMPACKKGKGERDNTIVRQSLHTLSCRYAWHMLHIPQRMSQFLISSSCLPSTAALTYLKWCTWHITSFCLPWHKLRPIMHVLN